MNRSIIILLMIIYSTVYMCRFRTDGAGRRGVGWGGIGVTALLLVAYHCIILGSGVVGGIRVTFLGLRLCLGLVMSTRGTSIVLVCCCAWCSSS